MAFRSKPEKKDPDLQAKHLYNEIGQLQIENDFLKKVLGKLDKMNELDNIYIEHLWKSFKYENIFIILPIESQDLYQMLRANVVFYNTERKHT